MTKDETKNEPPQFPTMLRKMWSGSEVQDWINENWQTPPQRKPLVFGLNDDGQFTFSVGVQTFTLDYFPENDEETEFMKRQLTHAIEVAHGIKDNT